LGDGRWTIPTVNFDFVFFAEGFHISFKTFGRVEGETPEKHTLSPLL